MKKLFIQVVLICLIINSSFLIAKAQYDYIENPLVFGENKEPAHASFYVAESEEDLSKNFLERDNYLLLNGIWQFHHAHTPEERPIDFYKNDYDVSAWDTIPVPSDWQLYGYDYPIYTNWKLPFKPNKPNVPRYFNPVGSYKRSFELPDDWGQKEVFLHFGGVNSAFFVWINGEYVGYSQDSKLPSEFNVTEYVDEGKNDISVEVYRYCDATYLEDQDMWRLSGIERDVYLYATPKIRIEDVKIVSTLDENYTDGIFAVDIDIQNHLVPLPIKLFLSLENEQGEVVWEGYKAAAVYNDTIVRLSFADEIENVAKWSAEKPNLYEMKIFLQNEKGKTIQATIQKVGFKKLEIKYGIFYVNGDTAIVKGVNRHEHDPHFGHCVGYSDKAFDIEEMRADLEMIKSYNFNAVRTAHYPNHPAFYDICDELGLYVCDEANIEGHWHMMFKPWDNLAKDKDYKDALLSRIRNMYERDKNHACVFMWSVGNETGTGQTMVDAYNMLKDLDAETPVFNERHFFLNAIKEKHSDFNGNMYAPIEKVQKIIDKDHERPFIWIEYAHAMGNSTGNFKDLWDFIRSEPQVQGGFIWDWRDQGLWTENEQGEKFLGYGGHFEPEGVHHDENFCANGLVDSEGNPHPGLAEVKEVLNPIKFEWLDDYKVKITNESHYFDTANLYLKIVQFNNNRPNHTGNTPSLGNSWLSCSDTILDLKEYYTIDEDTRSFKFFIEKGHRFIVTPSQAQLVVNESRQIQGSEMSEGRMEWKNNVAKNDSFEVHFSESGKLQYYIVKGDTLITDFGLNFWRAPTDNDFGNGMPKRCAAWREVSLAQSFADMEVLSQSSTEIIVKTYFDLPKKEKAEVIYTVNGKGEIKVDISANLKGKSEIPRVGSYMKIHSGLARMSYYGRGPFENYNDRKTGGFIGTNEFSTFSQKMPYIRPQEYGNRTDCSAVKMVRMKVESSDYFQFSAWSHSLWDIEEYPKKTGKTSLDVLTRDYIWLNIDYGQTGVGGDNSWGRETYEKYKLKAGEYHYSYVISPNYILSHY